MPYRRQNSRIENARRESVAEPAPFWWLAVGVPVSSRPELYVAIAYPSARGESHVRDGYRATTALAPLWG